MEIAQGFRAKSIKTRIETNPRAGERNGRFEVLEQNPSKQGLKRGGKRGNRNPPVWF